MSFVQWLPKLRAVKDFVDNRLLPPYPKTINHKPLAVAQMSAINISEQGHNYDKQTMASLPPASSTVTDDDPKTRFFEQWDHIDALAKRRFPYDENLQLEATAYVHQALAADDWKKLRAFKGKGKQLTVFISTVTSRLLTGFWRDKVGNQRPNTWLKRQTDPIYEKAYQLLVKNRYSKREALEILLTTETERELWKIQEVVDAVRANCPVKEEYQEISVEIDDSDEENPAIPQTSLDKQFESWNEQILLETLSHILNGEIDEQAILPEIKQLLAYLTKSVRLTEEDCRLLRLRHVDAFKLKAIAKQLKLTESKVDKRIKKTQTTLSNALKKIGLLQHEH